MSDVKGPLVVGKLKGTQKTSYIPYSDDGEEKPTIATEKYAMPRTGINIEKPFVLVGVQGGNKVWLAKYISGSKHTDAPTDLTSDSQYLVVGGREYGANSFRGIGYGYVGTTADIAPVFAGIQEVNTPGSTSGNFVIATRDSTSNVAPEVRMTVTFDGKLLAADGYSPSEDQSLSNKKYVDDLIAGLQKQIDDLKKATEDVEDVEDNEETE